MTKNLVVKIVQNGIIAAIYVVLTLVLGSFSFGQIQFRISEMLLLLAFFRPDLSFGLIIGTLLSNLASPVPFDFLFGTAATVVSLLLISFCSPRLYIAALFPIVVNAFGVGAELFLLFNDGGISYFAFVAYVAVGEAAVMAVSYVLFLLLSRNKAFMDVLGPTKHTSIHY